MNPQHTALLAGAGFLAGACNAIAGGGSLLTFPALMAAGLPPVTATVTNSVAVWPGYLGGTVAFRDRLSERRPLITRLVAVGCLGGIAGTILLLTTPASVFKVIVPYLILGATALLALQSRLSRLVARLAKGSERGASGAPLTVAIFMAGCYGAYFNGGLGIILLAILMLFVDAEAQSLNGTKALLQLAVTTIALVGYGIFGPVNWLAALTVAPACLVGGVAGGRVARRLRPGMLRAIVTCFGLVIGLRLLLA